jgi:HSP20 family protein
MNTLTRFNPRSEITRFSPFWETQDLFDQFMRSALRPALWHEVEPEMKMDITEAGNEYLVKAEIPGVKKDDIHVTIEGNMVTISAEVKHEKETKEGTSLLSERSFGKTVRSFRLDDEVADDKVQAKYMDGVLELKLPKKAGVSRHREINIS